MKWAVKNISIVQAEEKLKDIDSLDVSIDCHVILGDTKNQLLGESSMVREDAGVSNAENDTVPVNSDHSTDSKIEEDSSYVMSLEEDYAEE